MRDWRKHLLFYSIIAMMVSLFVSRSALSVSILFFIVVCFFHRGIKEQGWIFFSSPVLWGMSLLFLLPFISGLWSDDKKEWLNILRIKLPLLLLPFAFAAPISFSRKEWQWLIFVFIILVMAGTVWSMSHYVSDMPVVHEGYLRAKSMLVPLDNDHVRFSWLVAVAILATTWLWRMNKDRKNVSLLLLFVLIWLIIFLHILAARTGLLSFYILLFTVIVWIVFKKARLLHGAVLLLLLIALPVVAYLTLPTFRNKIKYFNYDFGYFKDGHYLPGGNDASRIISLKAGWNVMNDNGVTGTGFGDVRGETGKWYANNYPGMRPNDQILPSSEWLMYGAGCGIPGLLIFTFTMLVPFFVRVRYKRSWWLLNLIIAAGFMFDIGLEVQFGVFIYSFIVLLAWKWFSGEPLKT